ncbi:MAG: DUF429 domain-containing protein [Pseudomonadota bacterium]
MSARPARPLPRRPFGIDFSGAEKAGKAIWIAEGRIGRKGAVALVDCIPALALPGSGVDRGPALAALVRLVAATRDGIFGCDFPVGLPRAVMQAPDWRRFVAGFATRHASAEDFRSDCRRLTQGREIRRDTDRRAKTPFCAWNLRLYRQTYHGLADVIAPLHRGKRAAVLPVERPHAGRAWIVETCPASVLKRLGLYRPYKGQDAGARRMRRHIIAALVERGHLLTPPKGLRDRLVDDHGGDALDAVLACLAAAAALKRLDQPVAPDERIEGKVYFKL